MIKKKSLLFTIFYLPGNPVICQSIAPPSQSASVYQLLFGAGSLLVLLGFLLYILYRNRINQKILTNQKEELENQIGQLQTNYELQNSFFSQINHDLRNPVASLKNDITLLKSKAGYGHELDMLEQDVNALYLTLDNIIYWSLVQRNDLPFFPRLIKLSDILDDVIEEFDGLIRYKKMTILFDQTSASMWMDEAVLLLIVRNILFYTLNVSRPEETISIRIRQESIRTAITISNTRKGKEIGEFVPDQGTDKQVVNQGLILTENLINYSQGHLSITNHASRGITFILSWSAIHAVRK